jgi:hypothetical protein
MLHPLVDVIDLRVSGPEAAYDWLLPSLPRWSPRAHVQPRTQIVLRVDFGSPSPAGETVLDLELVQVSRESGGGLLVTAPRVGATIARGEIELVYEPSASPRCVQAVFDAIWPLVLPTFGLFHLRAAVVRDPDERGWVVAGLPGTGKSTCTLALASNGWHFAADDAAYVTGAANALVAHGWAAPMRISARTAHAFGLERRAPHTEMRAEPVLDIALAGRRLDAVRIHRLLFPEFGPTTRVQPLGAGDALRRLAAASPWIGCLPLHARRYLDQLSAVATLPASVVVLGPELLNEPERLAQHLDSVAAAVVAA